MWQNSATNLYSNSAFSWHWRKIILLLPDWMTFTTSSRIQINPNAILPLPLPLPLPMLMLFWWPPNPAAWVVTQLHFKHTHTDTHGQWEAFSIQIKFRWLPPFAQGRGSRVCSHFTLGGSHDSISEHRSQQDTLQEFFNCLAKREPCPYKLNVHTYTYVCLRDMHVLVEISV